MIACRHGRAVTRGMYSCCLFDEGHIWKTDDGVEAFGGSTRLNASPSFALSNQMVEGVSMQGACTSATVENSLCGCRHCPLMRWVSPYHSVSFYS